VDHIAARRRPSWNFPELVVLAVLTSYACLFLDTLVKFWLLGSFVGSGAWSHVVYLAQWVSFPVTALLLAAVGVCWWRCSQWSREVLTSPNHAAILTDVRRVRVLCQFLRASTGLATICALVILASVIFRNPSHAGLSVDAKLDASGLLEAASVIVFALLGFKGSSRVVKAASAQLNSTVTTSD
jgi:hypothetical protein